jgi:predicted dienelactone hydrolase
MAMLQRFARLFAILLSVLLMIAETVAATGETYRLKTFGVTKSTSGAVAGHRYAVASVDHTWFDVERERNIPARIYYPTDSDRPCPVIIFSTGLGRSRDDCAYLGLHWASCGYVSIHVQHKGSDEEVRQGNLRPRKELQRAFYAPQNIRNRPMDIIFVIHQLDQMKSSGSAIGKRCDLTRIGVAGHDFGAQTVLMLAGEVLPGKVAYVEPRVKAVVAMSSPVPLGQVPLSVVYGDITRPCLHITGTADNSIVATTQASQRRLPFDYMHGADQYLVTFYGADHMTYSGHLRAANSSHDAMFQRLIAECSAVFWDAYLKDDAGAKAWLAGQAIREHLATTARVEKKLADTL